MPCSSPYKIKSLCFLSLFVLFLTVSSCAHANNTPSSNQKHFGIKNRIIATAAEKKWSFSGRTQREQFCTSLLQDIQKGDFEEIAPFAISETYDDLAFLDIRNKCPDLHMPYVNYHYQIIEECSEGFQGYLEDFDNNLENGDELLLQCERIVYKKTDYETIDRTGELAYDDMVLYRVANLMNCQHTGYTTSKGYNYNTGEESIHSGGPINYKGDIYFLFEGVTSKKKEPYHVSTPV